MSHPDTPLVDARTERVEKALRPFVLTAAIAVLPLLILPLVRPDGNWHHVEIVGHWIIWLIFFAEVAILFGLSSNRRDWLRSHRFEVAVVVLSSPLVPLALAFAPAARLLVVGKLFKTLKLGKLIKLGKLVRSVRLMREKMELRGVRMVSLVVLCLLICLATIASIATGHIGASLLNETLVLIICGLLLTIVISRWPTSLRRR